MLNHTIEETRLATVLQQSISNYYPESSAAFIGNVSLLLPLLDTLVNVVFL